MSSEPQVRDPGRSLSVDALCARYGDTEILHDVSLSVAPGEVVSLLGPSGCGKTTLLRCIAGLERPTAGVVSVAGAAISGPSVWTAPERRGIGMVFQDGALFPHLNVIKNVAFGLPKSERSGTRPDEMLELVGLEGLGERMPTQLSGGQQQRVALARALAPAPTVLLLDEPFSGLDVALRVTLRVEVRSLLREIGVTAVFVTHDQDEAFVMGDRVAVLRAGILEQHGTPSELYLTPASPWVGKFVGDANVISGNAGASYAETGIGRVPIVSSLTGPVDVLVRPENLTVSAGGDAVVETIEYYGHDTRYGIRVGDTNVAVRVTGEPVHESGAKVSIGHDGIVAMAWPHPS
ncbi:MAG: ABC transporter ATP-binding protein [Actinobacteria bacterium]|nr:ABC transporter ATP-binding protein [Actinomycetota bacterium]